MSSACLRLSDHDNTVLVDCRMDAVSTYIIEKQHSDRVTSFFVLNLVLLSLQCIVMEEVIVGANKWYYLLIG